LSPRDPAAAVAETSIPSHITLLGTIMRVDATTVEVTKAFRAAGIRSILLKGPSIARWLYSTKSARPYTDCDLLVSPENLSGAEEVLRSLGFKPYTKYSEWDRPQHALAWVPSGPRAIVDLHQTVGEAAADPARVWEVLSGETEVMEINGEPVEVLNEAGRALTIALHLAMHSGSFAPANEDLSRAAREVPLETWAGAARIAAGIGALDELVLGLEFDQEGTSLVERLGLTRARRVDAILRAEGAPPLARGVNWMSGQSLRRKLTFILPNLFLSKTELKAWSPLAGRGAVGLVLAYLWRPLWVLAKLPKAVASVHAARRAEAAGREATQTESSVALAAAQAVAEEQRTTPDPTPVSLVKNFSWTMAGNAVYAASQWAAIVVLAQLESPAVVGQYALGLAISAPVVILANLALRQVLATDTRREYLFGHYRGLRVVTSAAAVVAIAAILGAGGYDWATVGVVMAVGLSKALDGVSDIFWGLDQLHERMDLIGKSLIVRNLLSIAVLAGGVVVTGSLFVGALLSAGASAAVLLVYDVPAAARISRPRAGETGDEIDARWDRTAISRLARRALPLGLASSLVAFSVYVPRYFVDQSFGTRAFGIFSAIAYLGLVTDTAVQALGQSVTSRFARYYAAGDLRSYVGLLLKLLAIVVVLGVAGVVGALVLGEWGLNLLYGAAYAERTDVLVWAMVAAGIQYVASCLNYALMATRSFQRFLLPYSLVAVTAVVSSWLLVPTKGLVGAAWAACIVGVVNCLIPIVIFLTEKGRPSLRGVSVPDLLDEPSSKG
jgi:O-antigen/teichoic acid export membrane protein